MKRQTEIKDFGSYKNLDIHKMTNLFLYGTLETPPLEHRVRTQEEYGELPLDDEKQPVLKLHLDMDGYMTEGPGRYAHASMAPFVQQFFSHDLPITLPDGRYTKEALIGKLKEEFLKDADPQKSAEENKKTAENMARAEFNIALKQYDMDRTSADYMERVYLYNSSGFTISKEAVFVIADKGATRYVENMAVHAFNDNFDFHTSTTGRFDWLVQQAEDSVLGDRIDPDGIGRTVQIIFDHKEKVPEVDRYDAGHFREDQGKAEKESSGTLLFDAYPDMNEVVIELCREGTIGGYVPPHRRDVFEDGQEREDHTELPGDTTVFETLSATHTMAVPVYDSGEREKEKEREDVGPSSGRHDYVPSVHDHDYNTLFVPHREEMILSQRKQLMEDILAYEELKGRPLNENELERVIAGAVHEIHEHHRDLREWIRNLPGLDEMQKAEIYHESLQWEDLHPGQTVTQETVLDFGAEVVMPDLINSKYFSIIYNHSTSQPSSHPQVSWR